MSREFPAVDVATFAGSQAEKERFWEQHFARQAQAAFADHGRGAVHLFLDRKAQRMSGEYHTTDDGRPNAPQIRALVAAYDPDRQVVMVYRASAGGRDVVGIVDLVRQH